MVLLMVTSSPLPCGDGSVRKYLKQAGAMSAAALRRPVVLYRPGHVSGERRGDHVLDSIGVHSLWLLSGLGHSRCWFGLDLILCRHLPTAQSPKPGKPM